MSGAPGFAAPAAPSPADRDAPSGDALLDGLGPEQRAAVLAPPDRPVLVVAGPGTGKTRTLITRIAHRVRAGGVAAERVVALTFTNRAAEELAERLGALLGPTGAGVTAATFHAWSLALLRATGRARLRVVDDTERRALVAAAVEAAGADRRPAFVGRVADSISLAKSGRSAPPPPPLDEDGFDRVRRAYEELLAAADAHDFDDLVPLAARAVRDGAPGLPQPPAALFVDEYQDLDAEQIGLLRTVAQPGSCEVFAIGDPDQAIYGFRGADPARTLAFERDWPGAVVLALGRSYRSSDTILNAASQLVAVTPERRRPRLWSGIAGAPHILVVSARDESAEAERVALLVERLLGGTGFLSFDSGLVDGARDTPDLSFADIAVLYRLRRQGESFAEALGRRGLPVDLGGGATEDPDERLVEATAALRLVAGRCDPAAARLLDDRGLTARLEPWRAAAKAAATAVVDDVLAALAPGDRGAAPLAILRRAARRVDAARERRRRTDSRAGAPTRPLDDVIEWLALHAPRDQGDRPSDRVSLLTLHAAKGLEWKVVIVAGCEDGLIPLRRGSSPVDVDEERRLLFVGLTRARHLLVLSRAERRTLWGERRASSPSPFVADIAANLLRVEPSGATETPRHRNAQLDLF